MIRKTSNIFIFLSIIIPLTFFGQTTKNQRELYSDFLDGMNKQNLSTKFLLNRGFINDEEVQTLSQFIESYDEVNKEIIAPMSQMDGISWKQIYSSLLESDINPVKKLPGLETINNQIISNPKYATNIPLLIFDVKGELLDYEEIQKSIANSPRLNPYNQVHVFGVMSFKSIFYSNTINFTLDIENYFTDTDKKPTEIYIDFSDGRGVQKYNTSQGVVTVSYNDIGEKAIKVFKKTILNGKEMQIGSSFQIEIKSESVETPASIIDSQIPSNSSFPSAKDDIISNFGGKAYVYNGADNKFDRPIIIVQGFDPIGQITKDSQKIKYRIFTSELTRLGYDMVYVMLNNTNLPLPDNTNIVKDILKQINLKKESNFESVLIGESMGGLLSRMALKELENERYDHKVGLYISFDAPHQGANIPPGYQHLFDDVMNSNTVNALKGVLNITDLYAVPLANIIISPFTSFQIGSLNELLGVNLANKALSALNSPAAKSMVVRHINPGNYFTNTQNYLNQLGYPSLSRNIALINGSNNNTRPSFTPGTELIHFPLWNDLCNELSLNAWSSPTSTRARVSQIKWTVGLPVPDIRIKWETRCILWGSVCTKVPVKIQVGYKCASFDLQNKERFYTFDGASYDNAPGSTLPVNSNLSDKLKANATFVPTASSIDLSKNAYNNISNPKGLNAITSRAVLDDLTRTNMVPFEQIYSEANNSTHVYFDGLRTSLENIVNNEIMPLNLRMQNKNINSNRDFLAKNTIIIGNDVNDIFNKNVEKGNVEIASNTTVRVNAGKQIILKPGMLVKSGSNSVFKIDNDSNADSKKISPNEILKDFEITIIGDKNYTIGQTPSFKVLTSATDTSYNYKWELIQNSNIYSTKDEFIIDDVLYPGLYTVKVIVTSKTTNETHSLSKVFKIKSGYENQNAEKNVFNLNPITTNVTVYPNPASNETTIIADKEISNIKIVDASGSIVFENKNLSNSWSTLNVSRFAQGIYVVNIIFKDGSNTVEKLIKN
jgi:hypothetical protein